MTQAEGRAAVEPKLDSDEEEWLNARIAQYAELLQYLHDH